MGVHLSLLSHAHQVCLPLSVACEWSKDLKYDIRQALLQVQCPLSSAPCDPPTQNSVLPSSRLPSMQSFENVCASDLQFLSKHCDNQVSVDLLKSPMTGVDPGKARLLPGLLDKHPQTQQYHSCPLNLRTSILHMLDCSSESPGSNEDDGIYKSKAR